jgi:geranylgeranyl diphosphate synthase type II
MNLEKALDRLLPSEKAEPRSLHKAMRYSVFSGGKRIRPLILIEASRACGGKDASAMPLACAIEFVHTYSLIHDDLPAMDDDDYRRGRPSCHKAFDESTAILAGDGLLTLAFETIARNCPPITAKNATILLASACGHAGMVGGQQLDLTMHIGKNKSRINLLKTAKLFEASASLGAIAANADKKKISAFADYGKYLGLAFQIADDIMDVKEFSNKSSRAKAKQEVKALIKKAKRALKILGKNAEKLSAIADKVYGKIAR